jgi:hypothetical protein
VKFRRKPVVVEAHNWVANDDNEYKVLLIWAESIHRADILGPLPFRFDAQRLFIETTTGEIMVPEGDWIVQSLQGVFYTCEPDTFQMMYEPAES